jgi:uncharacterized protein YjdB
MTPISPATSPPAHAQVASALFAMLISVVAVSCGGGSSAPAPSTIVTAIVLSPEALTVPVGTAMALGVTVTYADGSTQTIGGGAVVSSLDNDAGMPVLEWLSSDQAVATVDQVGNVMASAPGVATISVTIPSSPPDDGGAEVFGSTSVTVPPSATARRPR